MAQVHIQVTEEQVKKLKEIATRRGVTMADVIREAVERAIRFEGDRRKRAAEIAGRFRSGRKDVSAKHDRYIRDTLK